MTHTDRLVSTEPLPGAPRLSLIIRYVPSPYGEAEEKVQHGAPSGYYFYVVDYRGRIFGTPVGPFWTPAEARREALAHWARRTPDTYSRCVERATEAVWDVLARYEQAWPEALLTIRTGRYLLLRDLLALMEDARDPLGDDLADALSDVAYLKGVSTAAETPAPDANSL